MNVQVQYTSMKHIFAKSKEHPNCMQENLIRHRFGDITKCMRSKDLWIQEKSKLDMLEYYIFMFNSERYKVHVYGDRNMYTQLRCWI